MQNVSDMNRAWAAWFDLMTMPVWWMHVMFVGAVFSSMGMAASHVTKHAHTDFGRHHE